MKPFYFAKRKLQLVPAATFLVALAISIPLSAQTITSFDAPGAGTGAGQGTRAYSINPSGTITGFFTDSANSAHGYVRSNQGVITVFACYDGRPRRYFRQIKQTGEAAVYSYPWRFEIESGLG